MASKVELINSIVWWIPFKKLRNAVRELLLMNNEYLDYLNYKIDLMSSNTNLLCDKFDINFYNKAYPFYINDYNTTYSFAAEERQDFIAYQYFRKLKGAYPKGFYIDIGAHDGWSGTTTGIFYQLGWDGICVEPSPINFNKLKNGRPKATCINAAVSNNGGIKAQFVDVKKFTFLSFLNVGLSDEEYNNKINHIAQDLKLRNIDKDNEKLDLDIIDVEVMNFDQIMSNHPNIKHIDFLSLDVEGGELEVLKSIDFNKFSFSLLTIETINENVRDIITKFMKEKGYKIYVKTLHDTLFIPEQNSNM